MAITQLFLFDDGSCVKEPETQNLASSGTEVIEYDNVLVQDLVDTGIWSDLDLLTDARDNLREEVMESASDADGFLTRESKIALKLVSERLRTLQAQSVCLT